MYNNFWAPKISEGFDEIWRVNAKGEIIETSHIDRELVSKWYYDDFTELFEEQMIKNLRKWITPKKEMEARESELIFVNPSHFDKAEFIQKEQKLVMRLVDSNDIELWIEVQYNKLEENGIKFLEKLLPEKNLCFFTCARLVIFAYCLQCR